MFPYPIATPQGCNIQTFYATNDTSASQQFSWNKPVGVSHVYMMLIGAGGTGDGTNGGGSGAVTVWYGAAQHVPDSLIISPSSATGGNKSDILFCSRTGTITLLSAEQASGLTGGIITSAGPFAASGFYKSTAGQDGSGGTQSASPTTFLSGGTVNTSSLTANYGYSLPTTTGNFAGIFQMQPIIVGLGSKGTARGAIGCGGGASSGVGGPGMVLIASW
jgi:hypothetical protein